MLVLFLMRSALSQHDGRLLCPARAGCRVDGRGGLLRRRGHCRAVATVGVTDLLS